MRKRWRWTRMADRTTTHEELIRALNTRMGELEAALIVVGAITAMGTAVLVAGTLVVPTTKITATSSVILSSNTPGGAPGFLRVSARTPGVSFTILSSSATDTSTVAWLILEPA